MLLTKEAIEDIAGLVNYIVLEFQNSDAAEKLYLDLKREIANIGNFPVRFLSTDIMYRKYVIHKKVYRSYLIFYIVNESSQKIYILRVIKDIMDWYQILRDTKVYHFNY